MSKESVLGKIQMAGYGCDRCGHRWTPRKYMDKNPVICPKCKSPYWNKGAARAVIATTTKTRTTTNNSRTGTRKKTKGTRTSK